MKALIVAGGRGTRLRPLTHTSNKHLIPIGNEPMIYRVIKDIINADIHDIIINVNKGDKSIEEAVKKTKWNAKFTYIEQAEPNGMMYPIVLAEDIIGKDDFILHGGDNVLSGGLSKYIAEFKENKSDAHILVTRVKNPERFGVAVVEGNKLIKTVEKPKEFISDLAATAIYIYTPNVFKAMKHVKPIDPQGKGKPEYFPPPVHQWLIDNGYKATVTVVTGWWKDTGQPNDLLLANRLVLEKKEDLIELGEVKDSLIEGNVEIKKGTVINNCRINGPVSIGENVKLENCYIGPYTSIYDGSNLNCVEIENSIVLGNVTISNVRRRLYKCIIGWNSIVEGNNQIPEVTSLFIGDDSSAHL